MRKTRVRELLGGDQASARPDMPLTELVGLFSKYSVRGLPVIGREGQILGVVTETDLFLKKKGVPFSLEKVPTLLGHVVDPGEVDGLAADYDATVREVMTESAVTISPEATLWEAAQLMAERHVSILPAEEDGRWIGTIRRIAILERLYQRSSDRS